MTINWKEEAARAWDAPSWKEAARDGSAETSDDDPLKEAAREMGAEEFDDKAPPETNSHNSQFAPSPWPTMGLEAFHGLAGKVAETIAPHSEADPNGILLQFLVAVGNAIGPCAHF